MNREYVMLASTHKDLDNIPLGMYWSIKFDGMRALWLPTTRGLKVYQVPFCHDPEPDRVCTGLFSRYGKVIHAPDSFIEKMPDIPLDGELWTGRNDFQRLISICRSHDGNWNSVMYMCFDSPRYLDIFTDGRINNNIVKEKEIVSLDNRHLCGKNLINSSMPFGLKYHLYRNQNIWNDVVHLVVQEQMNIEYSVRAALDKEIDLEGEGLVGRSPTSVWVPKRSKHVIKLKPSIDDEAVIIDYADGKGKYIDKLGAYIVMWKGKRFQLSGMTDFDRDNPLAKGTTVTFRYRTLTTEGFPREARFVREFTFV